jgi:hypothetical protein
MARRVGFFVIGVGRAAILARIEEHAGLPHHDWSGLRSVYTVPIAAPARQCRATCAPRSTALVETAALTGLDPVGLPAARLAEPMAAGSDGLAARA